MSFLTLMFVVLCEVWWEAFGPSSYSINLAAVAVVAVGCTGIKSLAIHNSSVKNKFIPVQQSSFYGYTSMLPAKYTQAVMVGESRFYNTFICFCSTKFPSFRCIWSVYLFRTSAYQIYYPGNPGEHNLFFHNISYCGWFLLYHVPHNP